MEEILIQLKNRDINCEEALLILADQGFCPALLNDDNGHWAVTFDGFQNVPEGDEPVDMVVTYAVEKTHWKDSIRDALIYSLEFN